MTKKKAELKSADIVLVDEFKYLDAAGNERAMTSKEKLFCQVYLESQGNRIKAVYDAGYNPKNALIASGIAYENLKKPHIVDYINTKLKEYGYSDDNVETQHLFLINQHADLKSKAKGIDMFYQLRGKYAPTKSLEVKLNIDATPTELDEVRLKYEEELRAKFIQPATA